jgi:hypothetical protein
MKPRPLSVALAALLAASAVGVTAVSAQTAPPPPPPGPPPAPPPGACYRAHDDHAAGTVIGGLAGAAIGSNLAAHSGGRPGGAILGGLLGALIGHRVAEDNAPTPPGCYRGYYAAPGPVAVYHPYYHHYWYHPYYYPYAPAVVVAPPPPPGPVVYDEAPRYAGPPPRDGVDCKTTTSDVRMPDGSTEQRDVRVCRDASGRYRVVD